MQQAVEARMAELEARLSPGLHTLMAETGRRHEALWFAGEAGNWALADYLLHELEELVEQSVALHPEYDGIPVAELAGSMLVPALEGVEGAVAARDAEGFADAYDGLTASCNACHQASERAFIRLQRPSTPAQTNLRFAPD